jgi:SNF2 family DNA or RNA helicase
MEATITKDGTRILAQIPYAKGQGPRLAKTIPGARGVWDKKVTPNKFVGWAYPLSMGTCRRFREVFGSDLKVGSELASWARSEIAKEQQLELFRDEDSNASAARLLRVAQEAPALFKAISTRGYQLAGAAFGVEAGQYILGDEPGLGKTLQTLATLIESDARSILVACPRTATRTVWQREAARWTEIETYVAQGTRKQRDEAMVKFWDRKDLNVRRMLIINTEMMRVTPEVCPFGPLKKCPTGETESHKHEHDVAEWPFLQEQVWDAVVLDESHNSIASTKNTNSKGITQVRYGAMKIRRQVKPGGLAIACSGTPFRSRLDKSWGALNWCRPDLFRSFWRFAEEHFGVTSNGWAKVVGRVDENGHSVVEPLDAKAFDAALRPYFLARTKEAAAPDLPPIVYAGQPANADADFNGIWLDMEPRQAKAYAQMQKMAEMDIKGGRVLANGVLAEISRLRQLANANASLSADREVHPMLPSPKIDWIVEHLTELKGTGRKVVIASSFTRMVELTADVLRDEGFFVRTLTGNTTDRERQLLVEEFRDPDSKIDAVILNSKAGGEAITLDAADDLIFIDMPWTSDEAKQVEARIHRVSRIHNVTVYRLLMNGTVDAWIASLNEDQRRILEAASPQNLREMVLEALAA